MNGDIKYHVDKEKRKVVCTISGCSEIAISRMYKYMPHFIGRINDYNYRFFYIKDTFAGVARCSSEDEWDEEYGKKLALTRAKIKRGKAINKTICTAIKMISRELSQLETNGIHKLPDENDI